MADFICLSQREEAVKQNTTSIAVFKFILLRVNSMRSESEMNGSFSQVTLL